MKNLISTSILTFLILLLFNTTIMAVPAYPHPINYKLPDGTTLTVRLMGDEKVKWAETQDGYSILLNKDGYYEYAIKNENDDMIRSGIRAYNIKERSSAEQSFLTSTPKNLRFNKSQVSLMKQIWEIQSKEASKAFPTTGSRKLICILIGYTDLAFTKTQTDFNNLFNQVGYTAGGATGSVKDYYLENSYNQFTLTVDVAGPYTASNTMAYYGQNDGSGYDLRPRELVTEAVNLANAAVNYANYDNDSDGYVDGVYVIFAGYGEEAGASANAIWSHAWNISPVTLDGKTISSYSCSPELRYTSGSTITAIGVICHEFGHVLGAPDYYDTDYDDGGQFSGTGDWDMMAGGSWNNGGVTPAHHNGFTKVYYYEWADATVLNSGTAVTLQNASQNSTSFYIYNTTTSGEFFFIENREKHLFDAYIPGSGMIIYHVHSGVFSAGNSNNINTTHPQKMYPVAQNATGNPTSTPSSYGSIDDATCAWNGTGKTEFSDASLPSSKSWAGANTNKPITNISRNGTEKTVSFDFMGGATGNPTNFTATAFSSSQINLSWTKNDGKDVLLVFSTTNTFGTPQTGVNYTAGQSVTGGGTVIYAGGNQTYSHLSLSANTTYYYKIFSKLTTTPTWSPGIVESATTYCESITTLPYTQNFNESTSVPNCWSVIDNQGNNQVWQFGTHSSGMTGTTGNYAFLNSDGFGSGNTQNSDLISPIFNFSNYSEVTVSFKHYYRHYTGTSATFSYSINGGASWTAYQQWSATTSNPATFNASIPQLIGQSNVVFKWNYTGTWGYYWDVDDFSVTGTIIQSYNLNLEESPVGIGAILTGENEYYENDVANISASDIEGFIFVEWSGDPADVALLDDAYSQETSLIMPARDVTFTANYKKILTLDGLIADNKVYDGNVAALIQDYGTLVGVLNDYSDVALSTVAATATFSNKNAGTNKLVTVEDLSLTGSDALYYTIYDQTATADITPKELTVINSLADKVYDGTTNATVTGAELSGLIGIDDVSLTNHTSGTFASKNVGTDIAVTTAMGIVGADVNNYTLAQPVIFADITVKDITVTAVNITKAFGTTYAFDGTEFTSNGLISPDDITSATLTSDGADAAAALGDFSIIPSNAIGSGLSNYNISYVYGTMTVTNKTELTLPDLAAENKDYDGTKTASISSWGLLDGVEVGDIVELDNSSATITFSDKNVGSGKTVSVIGLTLTGADAGSYFIGKQTTTANITTKSITVINAVAANKIYDGIAVATISGAELNGVISPDAVILADHTSGTFAQTGVGTNIDVTTSMSISGDDADNYSLTQPSGLKANITAKELTVGGSFVANNKVYNGTTNASIGTNTLNLVGIIGTETVTLSPVVSFADKNVASSKTVSLTTASTIGGTNAGNYTLSIAGAPTSAANITAKALSVINAEGTSKAYDGTTSASISGAEISGLITGDVVILENATSGIFAQATVGNDVSISTSMTLSGTDAGNYSIEQPSGLFADITPKELTIAGIFTVTDKTYDGTKTASIESNDLELQVTISGDEVGLTNILAEFAQADAGNDVEVNIISADLNGADSENYSLSLTDAPETTAVISQKGLTLGGTFTISDKVYDGTTAASVDQNNLTLSGIITGDVVSLTNLVFDFAQANAGQDISVTITGAELDGAEKGNYNLSLSAAPTTNATISAKEITIGGSFTAFDKEYDGTAAATIDQNNLVLLSIISGDDVNIIDVTAEFSQVEVGEDITVSITGGNLDGAQAENYSLSLAGSPTATASITSTVEKFTLTLEASPENSGTVSGGGEFEENEEVTITAVANEGFNFVNWTDEDENVISTSAIFDFTMPTANVTLTANFEIDLPNLTFTVTNNQQQPVAGATIIIDGITDNERTTNENGIAVFELEPGNYHYTITANSYQVASDYVIVDLVDVFVNVELVTVSVETNSLANLQAYPNPFNSKIVLNNVSGVNRVVIANLIGQTIMELKLNGSDSETISTEKLVKGIYMIQFYSANGKRIIKKMVKE